MVSNSGKGLRLLRWALALFLFLALLALPAPSSGREGVNHLRDLFVYRGDSLLRVVALFEREVELPQRALSRSERAFTLSIPGAAMEPERRVFRVEGGPLELVEAREKEGERILITGRLRESQEAAFREVRLEAEGKTLSLALPLPLPAAPPGEKLAGGRAAEALVDKVLGAGPRAEAAPSGSPPRGRALEAGAGQLGPASPSLFGIGLKLALALGAILALFLGGASLFSRLAKGGPLGRKKRLIRLINKSYIGPKKSIALVEVAGEVLVVGISNSSISMLSKLENADSLRRIKGRGSFDEELRGALPKVSPEGSGERLRAMAQAFQEKLREFKKI